MSFDPTSNKWVVTNPVELPGVPLIEHGDAGSIAVTPQPAPARGRVGSIRVELDERESSPVCAAILEHRDSDSAG
jgi:hypothetical protein